MQQIKDDHDFRDVYDKFIYNHRFCKSLEKICQDITELYEKLNGKHHPEVAEKILEMLEEYDKKFMHHQLSIEELQGSLGAKRESVEMPGALSSGNSESLETLTGISESKS